VSGPRLDSDAVDAFWSCVDYGDPDECWPWTGTSRRGGYGIFRVGRRFHGAHRIAVLIATGEWAGDLWVLHSCDFPACCNPAHLRVGTARENAEDRKLRPKQHAPRGIKHQDRAMALRLARVERGLSQREIARLVGVSQPNVSLVESGQTSPRADKIARYAAAYGVPVETFIPGAES
jgi:predicted XRE-type DNA-binding protein